MSLTATSLVAAVPAGFVGYLIVMAYLEGFNEMATVLQVLTGITLVGCTVAALSPFGILIFASGGPKTEKPPKTEDKKKDDDEGLGVEEADDEEGGEFVGEELMSDDELETGGAIEEADEGVPFEDDFETADTGEFEDDEFDLDIEDEKKS